MMKINTRPGRRTQPGIEIFIRPVKQAEGEYIAFYRSEMLSATFSVYFKDNIMGALALNSFHEMIRERYTGSIDFCLSEDRLEFKNKALLDILSNKE
jgi:hypothetical protein